MKRASCGPGREDMGKILVVSDDFAQMQARALLMEFAGHQCEAAGSLDEAMELLRESSFDVVVTDGKLGDKGVAEIVRSLKGASPGIIIIALNEETGTTADADAVLPIPSSYEELFECIERLSLQRLGSPLA